MKSIYVLNIFFLINLNLTTASPPRPRCFGDLGCFSAFPINILYPNISRFFEPRSPEELNITFKLYTEENLYDPIDFDYKVDQSKLQNSPFDARLKTVFIIHGFKSSFDATGWNGKLKDLLLVGYQEKCNVIGIDWSAGAKTFNYYQAVADTNVVGAALAKVILKLKDFFNLELTNVHLIGHSLGGHIAGKAGYGIFSKTRKLVGRITALDPAGPTFQKRRPLERLDTYDAHYVDVLHTNGAEYMPEGLGLPYPIGDIDYFVNGGSHQPGCGWTNKLSTLLDFGVSTSIDDEISCSHSFASKLVLIDNKYLPTDCEFIAYQCNDYQKFLHGQCTDCGDEENECKEFSIFKENEFNLNQLGKKYFFNTAEKPPFCLFHYGISLDISVDSKPASGTFELQIQGDKTTLAVDGKTGFFSKAEPGYTYTTLIFSEKSLGSISKATVKFKKNFFMQNPKVKIDTIDIKFMSNSDAGIRKKMSAIMCEEESSTDPDGEMMFVPCEDDESE